MAVLIAGPPCLALPLGFFAGVRLLCPSSQKWQRENHLHPGLVLGETGRPQEHGKQEPGLGAQEGGEGLSSLLSSGPSTVSPSSVAEC